MTETDSHAQSGPVEGLQSFGITLDRDSDGPRIVVVGDLDLSGSPEFDKLLAGMGSGNDERLLLDLDEVDFMDSTGLAALVRAKRFADLNGFRLTLRYQAPQVRQLLDVCGMLDYFTFED